MESRNRKYSTSSLWSIGGICLIALGFFLAILSHPHNFPISPDSDWKIDLLVLAALLCTLIGVVTFAFAVRRITQAIPPRNAREANLGVGVGLTLQLVAGMLVTVARQDALIPSILGIASLPFMVWGCMSFAEGKGYPRWLGLFGAAGVIGLIVLLALPLRAQLETPGKRNSKMNPDTAGARETG